MGAGLLFEKVWVAIVARIGRIAIASVAIGVSRVGAVVGGNSVVAVRVRRGNHGDADCSGDQAKEEKGDNLCYENKETKHLFN